MLLAGRQIASCTLDASVKIYSYRVDSVHSEAYKVLGGIAKTDMDGEDGAQSLPLLAIPTASAPSFPAPAPS